ncbi:hypothetical protein C0Q70_04639 [Pomacea canaliculata]|uniref:Uncharacterized protein n=1 Tax=Pomacea canaliculata TaxID=400727 RepID=A0A2T7PIY8_POMCA|nr:hypothetical protein C0Q70_04639 [Pomacea canaliculata]
MLSTKGRSEKAHRLSLDIVSLHCKTDPAAHQRLHASCSHGIGRIPNRHAGRMAGHQRPILVSRIRTLLDVQSRFMMD